MTTAVKSKYSVNLKIKFEKVEEVEEDARSFSMAISVFVLLFRFQKKNTKGTRMRYEKKERVFRRKTEKNRVEFIVCIHHAHNVYIILNGKERIWLLLLYSNRGGIHKYERIVKNERALNWKW